MKINHTADSDASATPQLRFEVDSWFIVFNMYRRLDGNAASRSHIMGGYPSLHQDC
jgi:hypothetical protein